VARRNHHGSDVGVEEQNDATKTEKRMNFGHKGPFLLNGEETARSKVAVLE